MHALFIPSCTPSQQATTAPAAQPVQAVAKQQPYNEAYLDILLDALRNAQPGQDLDKLMVNTNPRMTVKQLEATCLNMQFVVLIAVLTGCDFIAGRTLSTKLKRKSRGLTSTASSTVGTPRRLRPTNCSWLSARCSLFTVHSVMMLNRAFFITFTQLQPQPLLHCSRQLHTRHHSHTSFLPCTGVRRRACLAQLPSSHRSRLTRHSFSSSRRKWDSSSRKPSAAEYSCRRRSPCPSSQATLPRSGTRSNSSRHV